jgi:ADP-ribose pyrophosphatase
MKSTVISRAIPYSWKSLALHVEDVILPNGLRRSHVTIDHPGAVVIIPINAANEILFISQFRHSVGKSILELPAGTLERGEDPEACAHRELAEEIGYGSNLLTSLGTVLPTPGFCNEVQFGFIARELFENKLTGDDDEIITTVPVPLSDVQSLIASGQLIDGKSIAFLLQAYASGKLDLAIRWK